MLLHRQGTKKVSLSKSRNDQPHSTVWHLFADPDPYPVFPLPSRSQTAAGGSPMKSPSKMRGSGEKEIFFSAGVMSFGRVKSFEKANSSQRQNRNQKLFPGNSCGGSNAIPTESSGFLLKSSSKKKEKEKEKKRQKEQDVEFELHSASGISNAETNPRDGQDLGGVAGGSGSGKGKRQEEKWMGESFLPFPCSFALLRVMAQVGESKMQNANADCIIFVGGRIDILVADKRRMSEQDAPPHVLESKQTALRPNVIANANTDVNNHGAASYVFAPALEPHAVPSRPISYENHQPISEPQFQGHTQPPIPTPTSTSTSPPQSTSVITSTSSNSSLLLSEEDGTPTPRASCRLSASQRSIRLKSVPSVVDTDQSYLEERRGGVGSLEREGVDLSPSSAYVTAPTTTTEELSTDVSPNKLPAPAGHEHGQYPPPGPEKNGPSSFDIPLQIRAPTPRRERDTIHGIVAQYAESHSDIVNEGTVSQGSRGTYDTHLDETKSVDSARPSFYGGTMDNEAGQYNGFLGERDEDGDRETDRDGETETEGEGEGDEVLRPPAPEMIFDLTPGREPSPARYKHGEPLHFGMSRIKL